MNPSPLASTLVDFEVAAMPKAEDPAPRDVRRLDPARVEPRGAGFMHGAGRAAKPMASAYPGLILVSKYRLVRKMGDGGMGEVWLAHHLTLDAEVAVKITRREILDTAAGERLLREARVIAGLDHPAIVRVLDSGVAELGPFMVMELLRGPSLRQLLARRRRLSARAAAKILLPVASALAAAHAHGVVHRDLKPDNVIVISGGAGSLAPKVFDFGIAKCAGFPEEDGKLVGSPAYMSPEQLLGGAPVDARADVWAFCAIFHELLSGRPLFARPSTAETLRAVTIDPIPPLPDAVADVTLSALLAKGLTRDPRRRWPSMQELGEHLAGWALRAGVDVDAAGTSLRARWLCPAQSPLSDPAPPRTEMRHGPFGRRVLVAMVLAGLCVAAAHSLARDTSRAAPVSAAPGSR